MDDDEVERQLEEEKIRELEMDMQQKLEDALMEAEKKRVEMAAIHTATLKKTEDEAAEKMSMLIERERLMKEKELKIQAQYQKNEEKNKLLQEREKLMKILADGKEKKTAKMYEERERVMEEKMQQMKDEHERQLQASKDLSRLEAMVNTPAAAAAATAAEGEGEQEQGQGEQQEEHQYSKKEMEDYLRLFFAPYDHDWSGYIPSSDFKEALLSFPDGPSEAVADQLVQSVEKDGYCCYEEFVQNYIREIGIQDDPEEAVTEQQQQSQGGDEGEWQGGEENHPYYQEPEDPYKIPCNYCVDSEGMPATHAAATFGHAECLEAYLKGEATSVAPKGALDSSGRTALFCACAANQFNCIALLLQDDDTPAMLDQQGNSPLCC